MHRDFKELFGFLNAESVHYLVVGGYDLMQAKLASGRAQDVADAEALRTATRLRTDKPDWSDPEG